MSEFEEFEGQEFENEELEPVEDKRTAGEVTVDILKLLYRLRGIFLSIPVAVVAVILAVRNAGLLPDKVGIDMQPNGEFMYLLDKGVAVLVPVAITGVCLVLTLFSKRVLYPWLISVFSLLLPLILLLVNTFPA